MENKSNRVDPDAGFYVVYKGSRVSIEWGAVDAVPNSSQTHCVIQRICSVTSTYYLLIVQKSLYEARFDEHVQFCPDFGILYVLEDNGSVLAQSLRDTENVSNDKWRVVTFDPLELSEEGVNIKRVCCSYDGVIFVSEYSDIYAVGNCGINSQSLDCYQPKFVRLFSKVVDILDVKAGKNFFVFLARKRLQFERTSMKTERKYEELPDLVCLDMPYQREDCETLSTLDSSFPNSDLESNTQRLIMLGQTLLQTEIYTMGSPKNGVLGTGDHIKRDSIFAVQKLKDIGVCSVSTGKEYTIVRTIDGSFYQWGSVQQQTTESVQQQTTKHIELSCPTETNFFNVTNCSVLEACCGDNKTFLLTTQGDVYDGGKQLYRSCNEDVSILVIVSHFQEYIQVLDTYSKLFCDMYSIDGFQVLQNIPQYSTNTTTESQSSSSSSTCDGDEQNIMKIFKGPFQLFPLITQLLEQIQKCDHKHQEKLAFWLEFVRKNRIDMELAENTRDFWRANQKNSKIIHFKRKSRRVILTSTAVPIKLSNSMMGLITPVFILFNDCLCQVGNHVTTFPLEAVWLKKDDSGITIKTPEKKFTMVARSELDSDLWYDQLESSIKNILRLPEKVKVPEVRLIYYHFTTHAVYSGVHAKGTFSNALMHGKCRLQFPSGKLYAGDIIHGVIEGFGRMFLPKIGLYKGNFKNGKFWGHGTLIMNEKEIYDGNFRNGFFHGHGHLQHPECVYIGEFEDNVKCGYGVMHQLMSGEKYLGMFADNKRIGSGICITASGNYFEGFFANGELSGKCIAVFPNQYYYEGECSQIGPSGAGKYYMVTSGSTDQERLVGNIVTGNILCGQLSGKWDNVRINNGHMEINVKFQQYPSSLGNDAVKDRQKWCGLFADFEYEIFDDLANATNHSKAMTFALWNRVVAFVNKQQEIENDKMPELDIMSGRNGGRDWSVLELDTADKLSLNSSTSCYDQELQLNKCHSQSQDTLLHGWDFYNLDLLSSFGTGKIKSQDNGNGDLGSMYKFPTLMAIMESLETSVDSFNDSALGNSDRTDNCISKQTEMEIIPAVGMTELSDADVIAIKSYLTVAFRYRYHPLKHLSDRIMQAFYRSYGCWKVKPTPLLAKQAMREWESISLRVYKLVRRLFPALPEEYCVIGEQREVVSHVTLLYPILLTENIYSMLFVLYANQYSSKDEVYRQNLIQAEKLSDEELINRLDFDRDLLAVIKTEQFADAIDMLHKLKEKYSPIAMLNVIENCMERLTQAHKVISRDNQNSFNADIIMPLTLVLLLRAGVQHLGAELALLDDLTDGKTFQLEMNGIRGYCLTTLKASYEHLANKSSLLGNK
ncbi:alsin homolog [Musca vetustissima]|uniref:alsin homolog n=1 Tax=Musca vetustissima TaxID=27455 RepID=UPI002AB6739F|nr:alsin homolog [Musca vetustissima]